MTPDYKSYLATQVVADKQSVSYRMAARALRVHVNAAKCMLYEFYEHENKKNPGSIYATYLIGGIKKPEPASHTKDDAVIDEPVPSSPPSFTSSMIDPSQQSELKKEDARTLRKTVSLVREETLKKVQEQYESITSIHIYSLSPGPIQDLVTLTDIGRDIRSKTLSQEDSSTSSKIYGIIQNPEVRMRKGKRPIITEASAPRFQAVKSEKTTKEPKAGTVPSLSKATSTSTKDGSRPSSRDSTPAITNKQPNLKRDGSSLFKAFAKQSAKPKVVRQETEASVDASVSGAEDVKMMDADEEGDSEDEALFLDTKTKKTSTRKRANDVKKERNDKAAKLRRMMDSDDEQETALPSVADATGVDEDPPAAKSGTDAQAPPVEEEKDEVDWSESDSEKKEKDIEKPTSSAPQRRRGKRKIMKKRTMKDEDGYLVTKEEPVWESFSEDEPEPVKDKPKSAFGSMKSQPTPKSSGATKVGAVKKKGDIMSFFGKK